MATATLVKTASMVVTQLLAQHGRLSDWELFQAYQRQYSGRFTRHQLGVARRALFADGLVEMAGRKLLAGEDKAPAQTWKLVA